MRSRAKVVAALEKAMLEDRGFEVPVVLMTPAELVETYDEARAFAEEVTDEGHHPGPLPHPARRAAGSGRRANVEARSEPGEEVRVGKRAVHLMLAKPYHEATTGNAEVEKVSWVSPPPVA